MSLINDFQNQALIPHALSPKISIDSSFLRNVLHKITANDDLSTILKEICAEATKLFNNSRCLIFRLHPQKHKVWETIYTHNVPSDSAGFFKITCPYPSIKALFESPEPKKFSISENEFWTSNLGVMNELRIKTVCITPLIAEDGLYGLFLAFFPEQPNHCRIDHNQYGIFAELMTLSIQRYFAHSENRIQKTTLSLAGKITRVLGSNSKPNELFRTIIQEIQKFIPCDQCLIGGIERGKWHHWYSVPDIQTTLDSGPNFSSIAEWIREIYTTKNIVNIPNLRQFFFSTNDQELLDADVQSVLFVPVLQYDECIAHLILTSSRPEAFTAEQENILGSISAYLLSAIQTASLYKLAKDRAERLTILNRLYLKFTEKHELSDLLTIITESAVKLLGADRVSIFLFDESASELTLRASSGHIPSPDLQSFKPGEGIAGIAFKENRMIPILDAQCDKRFLNTEWAKTWSLHGYLCQPICKGRKPIGVICCLSQAIDHFNEEKLELLSSLASQVSVVMETAHLFSEVQARASALTEAQRIAHLGNWEWDIETGETTWSNETYKIFGITSGGLTPTRDLFLSRIHPEDKFVFMEMERNTVHEKKPFSKDIRILQPNGETRTVHIEAKANFDETQKPFQLMGTIQDVTDRKQVEEELRKSKEAAEAGSRAKSEFLSTMSHELRTPLTAVIGFSDLLIRDLKGKDEQTSLLIPKIREAGKYLLSLIEDILDLDRIEAGKVQLNFENVSLNNLISEVTDSLRPRLPELFSLKLILDPMVGATRCDSKRMKQILINLIDNAIKYSPDGGTILVRSSAYPDEFWISVEDEGMGIHPEAQKRIFDRFHQVENGYTRNAGGLGIGLALARMLMEMHAGRIWVESKLGIGSKFSIALPRKRSSE